MAESLWNKLTESKKKHCRSWGIYLQTQICLSMCGQDSPQLFTQIWDFDDLWNFSERRREVTSEWPPRIAATLCFRDWPGDNCHSIGNKMWPPPGQCDRWPDKIGPQPTGFEKKCQKCRDFFLSFVCATFFSGKQVTASDNCRISNL